MTQYQHQETPVPEDSVRAQSRDRDLEREMASLRQLVQDQQRELTEVKRTLRRLQNEVRLAVNSFNLRNHG